MAVKEFVDGGDIFPEDLNNIQDDYEGQIAALNALIANRLNDPGDLKMTARSAAPPGWLLCDGAAISRTTYAALFDALGGAASPFGLGNGTTTFNLPDYRGRTPIGAGQGAGLSNRARGAVGGEEAHVLVPGESAIRNHAHSGATGMENSSLAHAHPHGGYAMRLGGSGWGSAYITSGGLTRVPYTDGTDISDALNTGIGGPPAHTHNFTTANPDGGQQNGAPHNNMQPYQVVNFIIKT